MLSTILIPDGVVHAQKPPGITVKPAARADLDEALEAFGAKEYARAVEAFRRAYGIDPNPALLFALAQAQRLSGDCRAAALSYEAFLRSRPAADQAARAQASLARCRVELEQSNAPPAPSAHSSRDATAGAGEPGTTAVPQTAPSSPPTGEARSSTTPSPTAARTRSSPPNPARSRSPWYTDALGDMLLGAGLLAVAGGVVSLVMAQARESAADEAGVLDDFAKDLEAAATLRAVGIGCFIGGGLLAGGGVLRFVTRGAPEEPRAAAGLGRSDVTVRVSGRF